MLWCGEWIAVTGMVRGGAVQVVCGRVAIAVTGAVWTCNPGSVVETCICRPDGAWYSVATSACHGKEMSGAGWHHIFRSVFPQVCFHRSIFFHRSVFAALFSQRSWAQTNQNRGCIGFLSRDAEAVGFVAGVLFV